MASRTSRALLAILLVAAGAGGVWFLLRPTSQGDAPEPVDSLPDAAPVAHPVQAPLQGTSPTPEEPPETLWEGVFKAEEALPALPAPEGMHAVNVADKDALSGETFTGKALLAALVETKAFYVRFDTADTRRRFRASTIHPIPQMLQRSATGVRIKFPEVMALVASAGFLTRMDGSVIRIDTPRPPGDD